ncbi:MAG: ABC transporter substrate-binding protein, partial [Clostridia bacterium]
MKKIVAILLVVALSLAMFAGCAAEKPEEKKLDKINIAYHTNLGGAAIVMAAKHTGLFEKYGFEPNFVGFTSGPVEVGAMASGDIDYGYIGPGATSLAIQGKVDILTFEKMGDDEAIYTTNKTGIKTLADLKGKQIGTQLGTTGETVLNTALKSVGLTAKDVKIVNMDMGTCVTAMISEQIDAVCVFSQYKNSVEQGLGDKMVKLAKTSDFSSLATPSSWIVTPDYLEKNKDQAVRFTALVIEAKEYYKLHLEEVVQWCSDFLKVP